MSKSKKTTRKCSFQSLENRQMMAGDMVAYTFNGDLHVHESPSSSQIGQDNRVQISQSQAGTIRITGAKNADGTTTLIGNGFNSNFSSFKTFNGNSIRNIFITTGGGNDVVEMMPGGRAYKNTVTIDTSGPSARDADKVYLDQAQYDSLIVNTGPGDDLIDMQRNLFRDRLTIDTGAGADVVIAKSSVLMSRHNEIITASPLSEADRDSVLLEDVRFLGLVVVTGGGDDSITVRRHQAHYTQTNPTGGILRITAGAGHDVVTLDQVATDDVFADLGAGRDLLELTGVKTNGGVMVIADPITGPKEWDTLMRPAFAPIGENLINVRSTGIDQFSNRRPHFIKNF